MLSYSPLAVALLTLHVEWFVQRHYLESIRDDQDLDPQFKSLLKHHWLEEAQHTKLDTLMVDELAAGMTPDDIRKAVDEYSSSAASSTARCSNRSGSTWTAWSGPRGAALRLTGLLKTIQPAVVDFLSSAPETSRGTARSTRTGPLA